MNAHFNLIICFTGEDENAWTFNEVVANWAMEDLESGIKFCKWAHCRINTIYAVLSLRAGTRYFYPATVVSGTGRKNKNIEVTGFVTRLTRRVPLVEQELLSLPEHQTP
jgi:hypothetical protein